MTYPEVHIDGKQITSKRFKVVEKAFEIFIKECEEKQIKLYDKKIKLSIVE